MIGSIKAKQDTWLKKETIDSGQLPESQKVFIKAGQILLIKWIGNEKIKGHCLVNLVRPLGGFNTWYTFIDHFDVVEVEHPKMNDFLVPEYTGAIYNIPGVGKVKSDQPISPLAPNFTWAEATHNGSRIPTYKDIVFGYSPEQITANLIKVAVELQKIRNHFKAPISINSWYRPPSINTKVGGASKSQHLFGNAVDFNVAGVHPSKVYMYLDPVWAQGGLASSSVFTHIDTRGYRARWSYGY
jgi:hypothetical protein